MCRALLISLCVSAATATEMVTTKVSITTPNTTYERAIGPTLTDHTLLQKVVYDMVSECDQTLETILPEEKTHWTLIPVNASETPQVFTYATWWNLTEANATVVSLKATECAMTVAVTVYYDAIDTSELYSVEGAPTVLNSLTGLTDLSLPMDNVYATILVLTLTSYCASGVTGAVYSEERGHYFANLSTETPTCTVDMDEVVEGQLRAQVVLPFHYLCDGKEVEVQLSGYYYNLSRETVAPPTAEPTAQPTAHPTAQPTAEPTTQPPTTPVPETMPPVDGSGSSGLAKGVVAAIVVVSSLVAVAGAAGVYFYCKVSGNALREEQTELILNRD